VAVRDNGAVLHVPRRLPSTLAGTCIGLAALAAGTGVLKAVGTTSNRGTPAVVLVIPVVVAGLAGGLAAALVTAAAAAAVLNLAFIPPLWTFKINSVDDVVAFTVFVAVAVGVGTLVASESDRRRAAERRTAEVEALHRQYEMVVAERERLMEESHQLALLSRADEQRRALLRSVSHDLRTPLAAIRALLSDLRAGAPYDEETRRELLEVVNDEAERLDRLVANLLSLSRIEAGAFQPDRQAVALDELVEEVVRRLGRLFEDVHVKNTVTADVPLVDADYSQLDQVLTNLLENGSRHSPPGSIVEVGARRHRSEVEVWVTDEGPGVDLSRRDDLFEPFRPGPGSSSSGIGLAICRAIIEAHGGRIDVRNEPAGGATFFFTLPVRHG
jgi:two-component system sensor histidine kinase KdpD